jgi:diguanylate cyclase (GGDEF)-like protein
MEHRTNCGVIAVVGNESENLAQLDECLVQSGYVVCHYDSGDIALNAMLADGIELIILDACRNEADGYALCRQIKANRALHHIPVVFVGGSAETEYKLEAFRCGGVDYISSPFHDDELVARLRTHIAVFHARMELMSIQDELRLSKDSLKLAHAIARLGHWEWEMDSDVVRWSDEIYRILGYEPLGCIPGHDSLLQRVHQDERERVREQFAQVSNGGEFDLEFRITLPDGQSRVLHGRGQLACLLECRYPHVIDSAQAYEQHAHTTFIGVIQDVTERKEMEQRLETEAHTDALTGCASRRYFLELAQQQIKQARQLGGTLSLLMLDLDRFKLINDSYGHHAGDLTLQTLADVCRRMLRGEDTVGRLGGEEFAVLLPQTHLEVAAEIAERLRSAIDAAFVPIEDGSRINFTASIGVATLDVCDTDIDALLYRADRALYVAKQAGRNRVSVDETDLPVA